LIKNSFASISGLLKSKKWSSHLTRTSQNEKIYINSHFKLAKAVKKHEDLLQKLLQEGSSLQKAASDDRDHLLAKLEKESC
jgi:hypothetical protein